jgi:hypothetical protein
VKRFVAVLLSGVAMAAGADESVRRLDVPLPESWQRSADAVLALREVRVPAETPLKFRVRIELADGGAIDVGTVGLLAQSASAGAQAVNLQLAAARALAELKQRDPSATRVMLRVEPVDRNGSPLAGLTWAIASATIELRH